MPRERLHQLVESDAGLHGDLMTGLVDTPDVAHAIQG